MCIHPTVPMRDSPPASAAQNLRAFQVKRAGRRLRAPSGFTLLEVIAAMALIVFLIGGVYAVGSGSVALGASMNRARVFETRITSFASVWREYLETLPPNIGFSAKDKKLLIENGTVPFAWTRAVRRADAVQFSLDHTPGEEGSIFVVRHLKRPKKAKAPGEYDLMAELIGPAKPPRKRIGFKKDNIR